MSNEDKIIAFFNGKYFPYPKEILIFLPEKYCYLIKLFLHPNAILASKYICFFKLFTK